MRRRKSRRSLRRVQSSSFLFKKGFVNDIHCLLLAQTIPKLLPTVSPQPENLNPQGTILPLTATHLATHTQATQSDNANNTFTSQDSTFGGGEVPEPSTTSISSSVWEGEVENGRRYGVFPGAAYHIPNDERQQEVEGMADNLWRVVMGGSLFFSPVDAQQLHDVIDIGTGTGQWSVNVGDAHPQAHVLGVDISPIQPIWVPPNVEFILDDVGLPWGFPERFNLVHIRNMITSIKDWGSLLKDAYQSLKPGGWLELQEIDYIPRFKNDALESAAQPLAGFYSTIAEGFNKLDIDLGITPSLADKVLSAGYVNVKEHIFRIPISSDSPNEAENEHGRLLKKVIIDGLDGFALRALTLGLQRSRDEVDTWLAGPRECLRGELKDTFVEMHIVCAQRRHDAH